MVGDGSNSGNAGHKPGDDDGEEIPFASLADIAQARGEPVGPTGDPPSDSRPARPPAVAPSSRNGTHARPADPKGESADTQLDPGDTPPDYPPPADDDDDEEETALPLEEQEEDPHRHAKHYLERYRADGTYGFHFWRGESYKWDGSCYLRQDAADLKAEINASSKCLFDEDGRAKRMQWLAIGGEGEPPRVKPVTCSLTANVVEAVAGMTLLPAHLDEPCWVGVQPPADVCGLIACRNTLVDVHAWVEARDCQYPLTPRFFNLTALPFDFDPNPPPPSRWFDFLGQLWGDDHRAIETLQEWFGYVLSADTSQHKIFFLLGPPRSGKGTIARILTALLGNRNVCGPTLASFAQPFGLQPLLGKRLAFVSDARITGATDTGILNERLLSISGEDSLSVPRKYLSPVEGKLPTRIMVISNELPRLKDASGALASRFILTRLTRSFLGQEDTALTAKLMEELPSILRWAADGRARLTQRGCFQQPDSGRAAVREMDELCSPVRAFVKEKCVLEEKAQVQVRQLFQMWDDWRKGGGARDGGLAEMFFRDLHAAYPSLDVRQRRLGARQRVRVYVGIRLRLPTDNPSEEEDDDAD
jgi:putative DNA primase/helicase